VLKVIELVRKLTPQEQRDYRQQNIAFVASRFIRKDLLERFVHESLGAGFSKSQTDKPAPEHMRSPSESL
jgi:hypothetical protein